MKTIGNLLSRDLRRKIEEIIQVDQSDEQAVYSEITEYVATDSIRDQYAALLKAIADAPSEPHESVGVWISGFFGSGKSSFAKNLGYVLENRKILDQDFAELFKKQIGDKKIADLVDVINTRFPTEAILFDVAKEQDTRRVTQRIAEFIYTSLLRELDYAEDFDVAELEIELEAENKLEQFIDKCKEIHKLEWHMVRKGAQRMSRASSVLYEMDPVTYPAADSWAHTQRSRDAAISVSKVVSRTFELFGRRRPGKALVFIIDEVGQHVARSGDKIEDLRATIEEFDKVGRSLLKAKKIPAPCWIVVTSQEKLEEVVAAIDSKRVELAKLQDRFRHRIDLAPSDIREVATRRVLAKKEEAVPLLQKLYNSNQGTLNAALRLERTSRQTDVSEKDFIQFYPYPPHYIDICISIMSGIRLQPGAPRHFGGSNRTIIKQAYEVLVSDRTNLAESPIGVLVTLDCVYELVEGNLSNERRTDIHEIGERFKGDPDKEWILRVAKAICLLEFVRDLPRTEVNIAAFLVDKVGDPAPLSQVQKAVKVLNSAQFIRSTEDGWKLQTAQEKNWETEKKAYDPKPRDRNEIIRNALHKTFGEPALRTYRYKDYRTFRVGISVDGTSVGDQGDIRLFLSKAEDENELSNHIDETRDESRQNNHQNDICWLFSLTPEIDELVAHLFASRKMIEKYDQLRAQRKITLDEATCLQDEKNLILYYESRLRDKITDALEKGTGLFRGIAWDASSLGKKFAEIIKKLLEKVVPVLYPKLEMGSRPLKGDEPDNFLKAADLKTLSPVFYSGDRGLGLVIKEGSKYVPNPNADVAKEVRDYLVSQHEYGNREACLGKVLERYFSAVPYGWGLDILKVVLALLFRAGAIEGTLQGTRYHNYKDPLSRRIFTNNPAFRSTHFAPRKSLGLKTLTQAVQQLEDLTGEEVDVEEGAIAAAFKNLVQEEMDKLYPLKALAEANNLPIVQLLTDFQQTLSGIQSSSSDDCVRILTETGEVLQETLKKVRNIRNKLNDNAISQLREGWRVVNELGWKLSGHPLFNEVQDHFEKLKALLNFEEVIDQLATVKQHTKAIIDAHRSSYVELFNHRREVYEKAIGDLRNRTEWEAISEDAANTLLALLRSRLGKDEDRQKVVEESSFGNSTLGEMESDIAAVGGLKSDALVKLREMTVTKRTNAPIRRLRVTEVFDRPIQSQDDLNAALEKLRDALQKIIDKGETIILE